MIIYVDKSGKVLKEVTRTVERVGKDGKSMGSSSGITITHEDKEGNVIREEKPTPKRPDSKTTSRRASTKKAEKED